MTTCIALLRGINVGRAKRLPMADLRELLEALGLTEIRTLLNSGNAVFEAPRPNPGKLATRIRAAILARSGFEVAVIVVTATELDSIVAENPLTEFSKEPSKGLVAFLADAATRTRARSLLVDSWVPERYAVGSQAAYLWCPGGVLDSKLGKSLAKATGESVTSRNWATVIKLQQVCGPRA